MNNFEKLGKAIKDIAEPRIPGVTKEQTEKLISLIGTEDGYGWKQYQAQVVLKQIENNARGPINIETLEKMARYNYPDNALDYVPALCIFAFFFVMLAVVLL